MAHQPKGSSSGRSNGNRLYFLSWARILAHSFLAAVVPFVIAKWQVSSTTSASVAPPSNNNMAPSAQKTEDAEMTAQRKFSFPLPLLHKHKTPPVAHYSGLCLDDPNDNDSEDGQTWSKHRVDVHLHIEEDHAHYESNATSPTSAESGKTEDEEDANSTLGEGFDGYNPQGQHMLMDIQHVSPHFLLDMKRIAEAMVQTTTQSGLTLLSYHCHDLQPPMGVSCVGVLLESHVSIHTWPWAGILSLDLFTCGPASLLPLVPLLKDLYAIPSEEEAMAPEPMARWLYKKRGFRYNNNQGDATPQENPETVELEQFLLGWKGYHHKVVILDTRTTFQEVAVFEMSHSHMPLNRQHDPSIRPNKKLYLDNVAQSSLHGLEAYHEALVHPALFAHKNPKRVAIIGGGEGATLREVLKHNTIETCTMLEIDAGLMELAQESLQEWNDCSDFANSPGSNGDYFSCFNDTRVEVHAVDAYRWFIDRFGRQAVEDEKPYDVIIMDALDPSSLVEFSDVLYGGSDFVEAMVNALTESGILIAQVGMASSSEEGELTPSIPVLEKFASLLESFGAEAMTSYSEAHGQFLAPWDFRVVFMNDETRSDWYSEANWVDLEVAKRAIHTKSGQSPFKYFDGASQQVFQYPSRIDERKFCERQSGNGACKGTRGFNPDVPNLPASSLELAPSPIPNAGRGVFFKESASEGSYIEIESNVNGLLWMPRMGDMLLNPATRIIWYTLGAFVEGYPTCDEFFGRTSCMGNSGINIFANHGCDGQNNIGASMHVTENTADPDHAPYAERTEDDLFYNPFAERNYLTHATIDSLLKHVKAGDEMLDNYLDYGSTHDWAATVQNLRSMCQGDPVGLVHEAETGDKASAAGAVLNAARRAKQSN